MSEHAKTPPDEVARLMVVNWSRWMHDNDQWHAIKALDPSKRTPHKRYRLTHWPDKKDKREFAEITFAASKAETIVPAFAEGCSLDMADPDAFAKFDPYRGITR